MGMGDSRNGRAAERVAQVRPIPGQVAVAAMPGDRLEVAGDDIHQDRPMVMEGQEAADGMEIAEGDIAIAGEGTGGMTQMKGHGMVPLVPPIQWRRL